MKRYIVILSILVSANLYSAPIETKALMHYFNGVLLTLKPYMVNYDEFKKEQNSEKIKKELLDLKSKIVNFQPDQFHKVAGFNYSYNLMSSHISEIIHLFDAKIYGHAWEKLNATTSFCIGCHTRLPEKINMEIIKWGRIEGEKIPSESLADAEFLYLSHQYPKAMEIFDRKIRNFDPAKDKEQDLLKIYERKLAFYSRVQRDPNAAIESLKLDLKNKKLTVKIREAISTWTDGFSKLQSKSASNFESAKTTITKNVNNGKINLFDPTLIELLFASGIVYEKIFKSTNPNEAPELLYLLAQAEKQLSSIRVYSLSDIYLFECVNQFPKSTVAKQCFNDYELSMKLRYSGTIPSYINSSISTLKAKMGQ